MRIEHVGALGDRCLYGNGHRNPEWCRHLVIRWIARVRDDRIRQWQPGRWWTRSSREREYRGLFEVIIARIGDHVLLGVTVRVRQQGGEGKRVHGGLWEFRDAAGGLDQVLLLLTLHTTYEATLMSLLTSAFFVRWVRPLANALLDARVDKRGEKAMERERGQRKRGREKSRSI